MPDPACRRHGNECRAAPAIATVPFVCIYPPACFRLFDWRPPLPPRVPDRLVCDGGQQTGGFSTGARRYRSDRMSQRASGRRQGLAARCGNMPHGTCASGHYHSRAIENAVSAANTSREMALPAWQ